MVALRSLTLLLASTVSFTSAQYGYSNSSNSSNSSLPYKNPSLPVATRVQDLLSRMTIEEKAAQLMQGDVSNWLSMYDYNPM